MSITWTELLQREPRLAALEHAVAQADSLGTEEFDGNEVWHRKFAPRVRSLIGWDAPTTDPVLSSSDAYEVAYWHLNRVVLPPDRWADDE